MTSERLETIIFRDGLFSRPHAPVIEAIRIRVGPRPPRRDDDLPGLPSSGQIIVSDPRHRWPRVEHGWRDRFHVGHRSRMTSTRREQRTDNGRCHVTLQQLF